MILEVEKIGRRDTYNLIDAKYFVRKLNDHDYFLSFESPDRRALFGFLRLRLNYLNFTNDIVFDELIRSAIIEELHVYSTAGMLVRVGDKKEGASQHCGIGKKLIQKAKWLAWKHGFEKIAVIAGEGVREYYKKSDFTYCEGDGRFMMNKFNFVLNVDTLFMIFGITIAIICILYQLNHFAFAT